MAAMGLTVIVLVTEHDSSEPVEPMAYVMLAVPAVTPVMLPDEPSIILLLVVLQVPPATASVAVIVAPWHTAAGPLPIVIGTGVAFTVMVSLAKQPPAV